MNFGPVVGASLRSGYALPARRPDNGKWQHQPADAPLIEAETLSRQSRPPLLALLGLPCFGVFGVDNSVSIWACGMKTAFPTLTAWSRPSAIQLRIVRGARPNISAISAIGNIRGSVGAADFFGDAMAHSF